MTIYKTRKAVNLLKIMGIVGLAVSLIWGTLLAVRAASAPALQAVNPTSNSHNAAGNTAVSITYDQNMDAAAVNTQTFAVHAMQTGIITETYSVNGGNISITPNSSFNPGELVQVSATTATLNITGTEPLSPTVWQFRIEVDSRSGEFVDSSQSLSNAASASVMLGDLDGDGDLDSFIGNNGANTVWLNDGSGTFTDTGQTLGNANSVVALGDLDGDGDLDAFDADFNSGDKVWLNDGKGTFSDSGQSLSTNNNTNLALGDLDGDGDLDAFLINYNGPHSVWFNNGVGSFTNSGQSLVRTGQGVGIALADTDGDGDLDAVVGERSGANQLWLNDGAGTFTNSGQNLGNAHSWVVTTGDLNGDGHVDVFFGNEFGANEVWFNDGAGTFTNSGQSVGSLGTYYGVQLGDLDGDDDLDVFVGTSNGQANQAWFNDGTGVFTDTHSFGSETNFDVDLGDLDGDGDLDAFLANGTFSSSHPNTVWLWEQDATPEIDVQGNGQSIVNGDTTPAVGDDTDFGNVAVGSAVTHTFTISNSGLANLTLSGTPAVTLTTGSSFSVALQPASPVISNSTATFQITFTPASVGNFTDTVNIASDDSDENPYTFVISGTGVEAAYLYYFPIIFKE